MMEYFRDAPTDEERGIRWKRLCGISCWRNCQSGNKNGPKKYPEARANCWVGLWHVAPPHGAALEQSCASGASCGGAGGV